MQPTTTPQPLLSFPSAARSPLAPPTRPNTPVGALLEPVRRYYAVAGPDYRYWSPNWNMHFGYYRRGLNPFAREPMLQELSRQVLGRLANCSAPWLDAGCGMGSVALAAAAYGARVTGVTIVPDQVEAARVRAATAGLDRNVSFVLADYLALPVQDGAFGGAFAIESACYAPGPSKSALIEEMARVIRPGGRWVIADGFLKRSLRPGSVLARLTASVARSWAIPEFAEIDRFVSAAGEAGFIAREVRDVSWNVAPSFLHIIPVTLRYALHRLRAGSGRMAKEQWDNVRAPLLAQLLGLARGHFGYYFMVLERR